MGWSGPGRACQWRCSRWSCSRAPWACWPSPGHWLARFIPTSKSKAVYAMCNEKNKTLPEQTCHLWKPFVQLSVASRLNQYRKIFTFIREKLILDLSTGVRISWPDVIWTVCKVHQIKEFLQISWRIRLDYMINIFCFDNSEPNERNEEIMGFLDKWN